MKETRTSGGSVTVGLPKRAELWLVRGPDPFLIYGPFAGPKEAQAWAEKSWPGARERFSETPNDVNGWEVEPLYPPDIQTAGEK